MVQAKAAVDATRVVRVFGLVFCGEPTEGEREFALRLFVSLRWLRSGTCAGHEL